MKKVVKNTKSNAEIKYYLDASAEIYNENLKGIREGSILVNRKLDKITATLSEHTNILTEHTRKLDSHTEMIGTLMEDVSILKEDVSVLKSDVSTLKSDVVIIKDDISIIKTDLKKKVDYDEFQSLVRRVQNIEAKI